MGSARGPRAVFGGPPKTLFPQLFSAPFGEDKNGWTKCLAGRQTPQASGRRSPTSVFGLNGRLEAMIHGLADSQQKMRGDF